MFEQMREAGLAGLLVARAHLDRRSWKVATGALWFSSTRTFEPVGQRLGFDVIGNTRAAVFANAIETASASEQASAGADLTRMIVKHGVLSIKSVAPRSMSRN